jgi:hypothetical protein
MVYKSRKAVIADEVLGIFEKRPVVDRAFIQRLIAELELKYGASKKTAQDIVDACVTTGRVKVEG